MKIAVSACLLGYPCKYNGKDNRNEQILALKEKHTLVPVCPEQLGGLPTPRIPCEICGGRVIDAKGNDRTRQFEEGADAALKIIRENDVKAVIVQPRSPSCGKGRIYDGTFSGTLTEGDGIFVQKLLKEGFLVENADSSYSCDPFLYTLK